MPPLSELQRTALSIGSPSTKVRSAPESGHSADAFDRPLMAEPALTRELSYSHTPRKLTFVRRGCLSRVIGPLQAVRNVHEA
jgi:hypothetical protein